MIKLDIYTDASGNLKSKDFGYAAVFKYKDVEYYHSWRITQEKLRDIVGMADTLDVSNPTVEVFAFVEVLCSLVINAEKYGTKLPLDITVYSDYQGVPCWFNREWAMNKSYIRKLVRQSWRYTQKINELGGSVKVKWVKGHNGDEMNERADKLAGQRLDWSNIDKFIQQLKEDIVC